MKKNEHSFTSSLEETRGPSYHFLTEGLFSSKIKINHCLNSIGGQSIMHIIL